MEFFVEQKVLNAGIKLYAGIIHGVDNNGDTDEWTNYRTERIKEFYERYKDVDVHEDPIIEGYNILHDNVGVKRRKNIPSTQNLIKILEKSGDIYFTAAKGDAQVKFCVETDLCDETTDVYAAAGTLQVGDVDAAIFNCQDV